MTGYSLQLTVVYQLTGKVPVVGDRELDRTLKLNLAAESNGLLEVEDNVINNVVKRVLARCFVIQLVPEVQDNGGK